MIYHKTTQFFCTERIEAIIKVKSMLKFVLNFMIVLLIVSNVYSVQVVKTKFKTQDLVLAEELFDPCGTAISGCSSTLQAAIDRVAAKGGGTVFLSAGHYKIDQPLIIKEGVTLRGDLPLKVSQSSQGTVMRIITGQGNENGTPAITIERGSGLRGLSFWYPEQSAAAPMEYPWTVFVSEKVGGDNQSIFDCVFVNSWRGVRIGPGSNELHTLRRVKICALKTGIFIDSTTDIGRISNVTITPDIWIQCDLPGAPKGDAAQSFQRWLLASESSGLIIGRSDWEYIWRLKVAGYNRGVVFTKGKRGTTNAVMAESDISSCKTALYIEALNQVGLSLYNSCLQGIEYSVLTSEQFSNMVQFHTCTFNGAISKNGKGVFSMKNCSMDNLFAETGELLMSDCSFKKAVLGKGIKRARILGFDRRKCSVENLTVGGDVVVISERAKKYKPVAVSPDPAVIPRPESEDLFVVTDFGASVDIDDNAVAFQKALDAAGKNKDGGTVYVPAGYYKFQSDITVPSGVELRGCFDVPHHTISDGSVLMPCHNAGQEDGSAFVKLESESGLRGLSFWYPEQPLSAPVAYPWCVQSQGKGCWIVDTNIGNAWQGVDFASHRSDGHVIQYLSGAMYQRGLFVGKNKRLGWVEDVQFNPHYMLRRSKTLPCSSGPGWKGSNRNLIEYQREHLKGMVFKDCRRENIRGTFLYAAHEGIAFYGKCDADILMHGSDTVSRAAYLNMDAGGSLRFALAQLVSLGKFMEGAIVSSEQNRGVTRFQNSQVWAGDSTALLKGNGITCLDQFNSVSGPVTLNSGCMEMELGVFAKPLPEQLVVNGNAAASAVACVNRYGPFCSGGESSPSWMYVNSNTPRIGLPVIEQGAVTLLKSSFESGDPEVALRKIASPGGGVRKVSDSKTRVVKHADAHSGQQALLFTGHSDDPSYSFTYHDIIVSPVTIMPDTTLSYWKKPLNDNGRSTAADLYFRSGKVLRMLPCGRGSHAGTRAGKVGEWQLVSINLGSMTGDIVDKVMICYDTRSGGGLFEVLFDDIVVGSQLSASAWQVKAEPHGGSFDEPPFVSINHNPEVNVFYTLDGTDPTTLSTLYTEPFELPEDDISELRYAPVGVSGKVSSVIFGEVYRVD
jgi:hypothetical protein